MSVEFKSKERSAAGQSGPYCPPERQATGQTDMNHVIRQDATAVETDPRWTMVMNRDAGGDGVFVYAVKTTGVYCRPSCPSRRARAGNVVFFTAPSDAEASGFRPCQRCHPNGQSPAQKNAAVIEAACRLIDASEELPNLHDLAAEAGMSPYHFHRQFKAITGLTPKAYGVAHRAGKLRSGLADTQASVTGAIYDAGFNSSSRFYEQSNALLGMTPTSYRNGGAETVIRFAVAQSSLGAVLVACSDKGICAITLGEDADDLVRDLQDLFPNAGLIGGDGDFEQVVAQVVGFVEAPQIGLDLPLDIRGTAFQQRVWQALRQIPAGTTASYTEIARSMGQPTAARAVARACAANRLAVAIPCHRVVRTDGSLSGYRWGVERKRALLDQEEKG